jgi:large subunit ribosomal protein L10
MKDETPKVSANRQKKEALLADISEKISNAKGMVFTNYQGLTHQQLETMKRALKKVDAEYVVIKNTLLLRGLANKELTDEEKEKFQQPTGVLFFYSDVVAPLKELARTVKELSLPAIKFGLLENKTITDKEVLKLSTLPPIEVLRAQLLGQMMSPIQGLHRALNWNLQSLVMTLNAIAKTKS